MTGKKKTSGWEALAAIIGITFGVVPLIRAMFGSGPGLWWRWLVGDPPPTLWWLLPLGVAVVAISAVTYFDRLGRGEQRDT